MKRPGASSVSSHRHRAAIRAGDLDRPDRIAQRAAGDRHGLPLGRGGQRLFLEFGLLHHPVRQPAQQFELRPAALVAARPEPGVIRRQQRHPPLADPVEHQQRPVVRRRSSRRCRRSASTSICRNQRPQGRPSSRPRANALEPLGHRVALRPMSVIVGTKASSITRPVGAPGRILGQRRAIERVRRWRSPARPAISTAPPFSTYWRTLSR